MLKNPCRDCEERKLKCHEQCDRYKAWLKDYKAAQADSKKAAADARCAVRYSG